jgi:hypothetical protein
MATRHFVNNWPGAKSAAASKYVYFLHFRTNSPSEGCRSDNIVDNMPTTKGGKALAGNARDFKAVPSRAAPQ